MEPDGPPRQTRTERRKAATRGKIVNAASRLFRAHGFDATTMERIAEEADVAKATLYSYFSAKEAILNDYVKQAFQEQNANKRALLRDLPDTRARLTAILNELIKRVQAQHAIFEKYLAYRVQNVVSLHPPEGGTVKSDFDSLADEIITLGQAAGDIRADLPRDMLIDLFEFVFVEIAKRYYMQPDAFDARAAIEQGVSLYLNGASPAP
ncbi:TetR/AcrR family transcriptional regulator [Aggregatilinea lenta]|uniref:TetR/AcrR family transcriptional regulator n=1 Tax=Aggregatilinea lenta TaxID=913108 RepID=UPI000E5B048A|nr:TetR/AcrR family transcriptional regulator [Aggregatilinea lenta]